MAVIAAVADTILDEEEHGKLTKALISDPCNLPLTTPWLPNMVGDLTYGIMRRRIEAKLGLP